MRLSRPSVTSIVLLLGVTLCVAVYYPGLHGGFIFDDWPNILLNSRLHVSELSLDGLRTAAFSMDSGTLMRPISMLSFWANYYVTGLDPFYFKVTNLFIHLLNGIGLFWLARSLLQNLDSKSAAGSEAMRDRIALAAALIWLVHPLNVTSVLYVVQRMTSLSAMFTILALISYVAGRQRLARRASGFPLILFGLGGFGALSVLSKENGALLPLFVAAIELAWFRFAGVEGSTRTLLKAFAWSLVAAPLFAFVIFATLHPEWLMLQYQHRAFTLAERLMTEARVLWLYVAWLVAPTRSALGLFHDDIQPSHSLIDPTSTAVAIAGIVAVLAAALRLRERAPIFTFAVTWYLAGHVLESSFVALDLVHEHRNYLPIFGPLLAGAYGLSWLSVRLPRSARFALPALFVAGFSAVTFGRSLDWSDLPTLQMASAHDHPNSARANYEAGTALANVILANPERAPEVYDEAKKFIDRAATLDDSSATPLFSLILLDASAKRPLDQASMESLATRLGEMPLNQTVIEPFRSLVDWLTKGTVVVPENFVVKLFESALSNPTADHRTRALLLSVLSSYYYNVAGDSQNAVSMALAAVAEDPSQPVHHLSLAKLAILLDNFDVASRELEAATRNDPLRRFTLEIEELAGSLQKRESEAPSAGKDLALR
jgi:hypothetical protein